VPLTVDGLIYVSSIVMLDSARRKMPVPALARRLLGVGIAATLARRYLFAGLLACGVCGRRLESAWSNGRPAYRCRHGYSSATARSRPAEEHLRPRGPDPAASGRHRYPPRQRRGCRSAIRAGSGITAPARTADPIDQLCATGTVLTYDPDTKTIRAADNAAITVDQRS
jgi:site-specific DNA recombinase